MESKKINWNKLLNGLIAGLGLILASLFIGLCFILPVASVKALTKEDIINDYNIHFVSAKTKIRTANAYNQVLLEDNPSLGLPDFYSYHYKYNTFNASNLYYSNTANTKYGSENGQLNLISDNNEITLYQQNNSKTYLDDDISQGYVPNNITHYRNLNNNLEKIFYNEIDNGDFVLLNNYKNHTTDANYTVENFYLSFGTPYTYDKTTTPLNDLEIEARLYTDDQVYNIVLNDVLLENIGTEDNKIYANFWFQYFDLRNLQAKVSGDPDSDVYDIKNQEGKYEFIFRFIRYDENLNAVTEAPETFTYTFYLLDGTNYNNYPTISNAEVGSIELNAVKEYFYNFTTDNPYLTYNPNKYNVSYTRENREIYDNITSNFATGTYTYNGKTYPKGIITYKNNDNVLKEVYILVYYNTNNTLVEYLYLANTSGTSVATNLNYEGFKNLLANDKLKFEYKLTQTLITNTVDAEATTFTTNTYKTYDYANCKFLTTSPITIDATYNLVDSQTIKKVTVDNTITYSLVEATETTILTNTIIKSEDLVTQLSRPDGIYLNHQDLTISETALTYNNTKYKLVTEGTGAEKVVKLVREYKTLVSNGTNTTEQIKTSETILDIANIGNHTITDEKNTFIDINYVVTDNASEKEISSLTFTINNSFSTNNFSYIISNTNLLNKVLYPNKLDIDYSYDLKFEELGVYNFNYNYVSAVYIEPSTQYVINNTTNSTNITNPYDYALDYNMQETGATETIVDNKELTIDVWGYLNANNEVSLNGTSYLYNSEENTITYNGNKVIDLNSTSEKTYTFEANGTPITVIQTFKIITTGEGVKLVISYNIGTYIEKETKTTLKSTYNYLNNGTPATKDQIKKVITKTTFYYNSLNILSADIPNNAEWSEFRALVANLEIYLGETNKGSVVTTETEQVKAGADRLHIFGSITYFNKDDSTTDSGYAKLEQVDSKENFNFVSDVTKNYVMVNTDGIGAYFNSETAYKSHNFKGFSTKVIGNGENQINAENIIITDLTPTLWKNFSKLLYDKDATKVSLSYIYRYKDYTINNDGTITIDPDTCETATYTKDTYCQFDGLYEIVVAYRYDNIKSLDGNTSKIFYQLFTFIIDNTAPKLTIEVKNEDNTYSLLGSNKYTNKDVRISWDIPTYFKSNVYIDISKRYYNETNTEYNFKAIYKDNNKVITSGTPDYINAISSISKNVADNKYYVTLSLPASNANGYTLNGIYDITLHYSANGASTTTEQFIIDRQNIAGFKILEVLKNDDGTYSANIDKPYYYTNKENRTIGSQILNTAFTFRYDRKESGAEIYTYWHKIELENNTDYDKLINSIDGGMGITTTMFVNGTNENIASGNPYIYTYETGKSIANSNYFISNNSSIYLFRMKDDAGNEARFIIFYDTTQPRFLISPKPDNINNIVNDTTKITWGDYKAIEITTPNDFTMDLSSSINNYSKLDYIDRLKESLLYINSSEYFNEAKIELIDDKYYILIPITDIQLKDEKLNNQTIEIGTETSDFYFFPTNPISSDENYTYISLPVFENDGTPVYEDANKKVLKKSNYQVVSYNIEIKLNVYEEAFERYITATYLDKDNNEVVLKGSIGSGKYYYSIFDKLNNSTSGDLWMNLDRTQTMAYALFEYTENMNKAVGLTNEEPASYSAARLFMTSLAENQDEGIYDYTVTYKHYAYNSSLYTDYTITNVGFDKQGKAINLVLTMKHKTTNQTKEIVIEIIDEDGNRVPAHSYPYDLDGNAVISDALGNPSDIYDESLSSYTLASEPNRKFTSTINATTDVNNGKIVTQEGLYVFKREYTQENIDLGTDSRIIYRVYYIDRSGIINISTLSNIADNLYNIGKDISFELGSTYNIENYKKTIDALSIQNNQTSSTTTSNTNNSSLNLFTTNKIQVTFNLTADKHNFISFYNDNFDSYKNLANNNYSEYLSYLSTSIFNTKLFSDNIYKLNLQLQLGAQQIINENSININNIYDDDYIEKYLKGDAYVKSTQKRYNYFNFFYGDNNAYFIQLNDQSGFDLKNSSGEILQFNYQSNQLKMSFNINHNAPTGDMYGKYYGRHDYDEGNATSPSIPLQETTENGKTELTYALISKYLSEGQLQPLSETSKSAYSDGEGQHVTLYSTNNETLVFLFTITNDDYMAKIDTNNIQVYKGGLKNDQLIFNRVNGVNIGNNQVSADRMTKSFIKNTIDGTTYYAIIIFDNNLDEILDEDEIADYSNYRLLDYSQNLDEETYYVKLNYVGNKEDYVSEDNEGNTVSYFTTTYEIAVDRIKPTYNLTKLMSLDKYVYNTVTTLPTQNNFETVFENFKPFYNFTTNEEYDFERSDLENYFFAVDYRTNTSFKFESISNLDNNRAIYIRPVNINDYYFSLTSDDYRAYYNAVYLQGHPQFAPSKATTITDGDLANANFTLIQNQYYHIPFALSGNIDSTSISVNFLNNKGILLKNNYYEVIESDEAGNYRVYGIYIPELEKNSLEYSFQVNSTADPQTVKIEYGNNPLVYPSGMNLQFTKYENADYFIKAILYVNSKNLKERIYIYFDPNDLTIYVTNSSNQIIDKIENLTKDNDIETGYKQIFLNTINEKLEYYNELISSDKTSQYYSEYGYNVTISIVDRIGINLLNTLYNYEIEYTVAGSILSPIFVDGTGNFTITVPAQTGSTYITKIRASKFNTNWQEIASDIRNNSFFKSENDLRKGFTYTLSRGVYKFTLTDNFNRENVYFHEYGISSSQAGGSLRFDNTHKEHTDGYNYTSYDAYYTYDNTVYNIYIKFVGEVIDINNPDGEYTYINDGDNQIIYSSESTYSEEDLLRFGLKVIASGDLTTITFTGVKDLSKYHIKTILASTATESEYTWNKELTDKNILVYDKKVAIYTAIPNVNIKNLNGNTLDTSEHLNLTEDFELVITWNNSSVLTDNKIDFNSRIVLVNNTTNSSSIVNSGYIVTIPGDYTAYVLNDLNMKSKSITFTRGDGEISMYAVYTVDRENNTESKLIPSSYVTTDETDNKIIFTYFTTDTYFSYKDTVDNISITEENITNYSAETDLANRISIDKTLQQYLDVRVNSNLSIFTEVYKIGIENYPYVQYRVFSKNNNTQEMYTYRYIKVMFIDKTEDTLTHATVTNFGDEQNLISNTSIIKSTSSSMYVNFEFRQKLNGTGEFIQEHLNPIGDTIFVDRYYNGMIAETLTLDMSNSSNIPNAEFNLTAVGLHQFVIRDLAGRIHNFGDANILQIYLINQILYQVNDNSPINNQIFNGDVKINVQAELAGLTLYSTKSLGITVIKNGYETTVANNNGELTFSESGYYTVKMVATTALSDGSSNIADQEIYSTYNFVIIKTDIALRSFNVSKGTGFTIEKLIKYSNGEIYDLTEEQQNSNNLLWLTYKKQSEESRIFGNSTYEITLKSYNEASNEYNTFTFNVWINDELPTIISSVPDGTATKEVISLNYNPGLIYSQVGKCYILFNDTKIVTIDENSNIVVETISISENGTHWIKIVSEDGTLISSYKYTKNAPMNSTTKIILICAGIGVVVLVVIFFFIRRKGKYR